ncbi:MAG TPA: 1,4-alpha-glucan branching protein GlgB [Roseomonas sp.]|jgi:1,4-alpha-glucan branching enzyme
MSGLDDAAVDALVQGRHGDPFAILGRHGQELRCLAPGADAVEVLTGEGAARLARRHPAGFFLGAAPDGEYRLRIHWPGGVEETEDSYGFGPLLGGLDLHLFAEGRHLELAHVLGAQCMQVDGIPGVRFAVWAPNARRVSVVGDFNRWDGRRHPMRLRREAGLWEIFIPRLGPGAAYKYELLDAAGQMLPLKADPLAQQMEPAPGTASRVVSPAAHVWEDGAWMAARAGRQDAAAPISVYEVHAASWWHDADGRPAHWDMLADRLLPYVTDLGFTHIELLPIAEHPFGGSWGYQPLGLFAPSGRFGPPQGFARFVDRAHQAGIGVILDWVPAHFPTDAHGLYRFDGTALYEHGDPREGMHQDWNTAIYNFGRHEVRGFLLASAVHWLEHFHVDALRVDAVASMLYRDYSRGAGQWIPNRHGGRENLEAVDFLREVNTVVAQRCPGAVMIAEESTAWPGVTAPVSEGGLGFAFKWNMGWMHDSLEYMKNDPVHRRWHHDAMTFSLVYAWSERFILPLSHDEVVHGKASLLGRMPGDDWRRFANLRAYYGFMWGHPGKKLLFMGGEFAQPGEWNHDVALPWALLDDARHRGVQRLVADLNALYRAEPALHRLDADPAGFRWVIGDDRAQSVFAWLRQADGAPPVLVVANLTPEPRRGYRVGVPASGGWREVLNTDATTYGGSGLGNAGRAWADAVPEHGQPASLSLTLPPLATIMLVAEA